MGGGERRAVLKCPSCGYDLVGLERGGERCPECGARIDWERVRNPPDLTARRVRGIVLILTPHLAAAVCMASASLTAHWWGSRELGGGAALLLGLAYVFSAPFCAIAGVHEVRGKPEGAWRRVEAAVFGVGVCVLMMGCTGCGLGGALWGFNV